MLYIQIAWSLRRYFYYATFFFETGSFIATGIGYNGAEMKDDKIVEHKWDRVRGLLWWEAETANNVNSFMRAWNHRVHLWIKFYLAERLVGKDGKPAAWQYVVIYCVSAFWHGFYPFYYVSFSHIATAAFAHKSVY